MNIKKTILFSLAILINGCSLIQEEDFGNQTQRLEKLSAENRLIAEDLITFIKDSDNKYFSWAGCINLDLTAIDNNCLSKDNGNTADESFQSVTKYSDFDVRVARGPIVEKMGRMISEGKMTSPGRGEERDLLWGRFYSIDVHPKTPLVGMLHATLVLQIFEDGSIGTGGWLDVMPGTRVKSDINYLKKVTDEYFEENNADPSLYRRLVCKGTEETIEEFRRKPSCSGVSFYGPPVFRESGEKSYRFIKGMYSEFVDAYFETIQKRMNDPYTEEDLLAQEKMRKSWLIDQLFSDPFASKIVPFEVWATANVAPTVKF
jgi:coproporphyrinogen III oxidase